MSNAPWIPQGYVAGRFVHRPGGPGATVFDPADGKALARVAMMDSEQVRQAVASAAEAARSPAPAEERRRMLTQIAAGLEQDKHQLARTITLENGKPLKESIAEVEYAAGFFRFFADNLGALADRVVAGKMRGCDWVVHHRPAGVAGLIVPWNFPLAMLAKKLSAALAAGCATVTKPAPKTPATAIGLWSILDRVGLPAGLANLVIGDAEAVGRVLCTDARVRVISFTGSTAVGKLLAARSAGQVKRLALELGGNAPCLVFADADLPAAAAALVANKFRAAGQTCVCTNRVLVERGAAGAFLEALAPRVAALKVGHGLEPGTDVGPLIGKAAWEKVDRHVRDALGRGAQRLVGFDPPAPKGEYGCFYPPTLLSRVGAESLICREETFGPVVAVTEFDGQDEAVELANGTPAGLAAYVFSGDARRIERVVPRLLFGHVGVNTGTGPTPEAPFGGFKESGIGREGGVEGMLEFCEVQTVARDAAT